jgi:murein DD-endopeptidase MepM/ murein hydrolase activator NlpD
MKTGIAIILLLLGQYVSAQRAKQPRMAKTAHGGNKALVPGRPAKPTAARPVKQRPVFVAKPAKPRQRPSAIDSLAALLKGNLQWPFASGNIAEPFGHADQGSYTLYNPGITFASPAPVMARACHEGTVTQVAQVAGKQLVITHRHGIYMGYYNLAEVVVQKGAVLKQGDAIGTLGEDGAGGYQLLFLLQLGHKTTDPTDWFVD